MKNAITHAIHASFAILIASLAGTALAVQNAPEYVNVRRIAYAGTGCPAGSVAENIAPDKQAFTLLFDSYVAELGPGVAFRESRKNCAINIDLDFPGGWSFTILDVDYRGFANLERGVTGTQKSSYYFQGDAHTASLQSIFRGSVVQDYQVRDTLALEAQVWSPCGAQRALTINTQVRLESANRRAQGLMTIDSIDGQLTHIYGIQWRRCH